MQQSQRTQVQQQSARGIEPAPLVAGLAPYSSGRPVSGIDLFLDSNEGPPPPAGVAEVLAGAVTAASDRLRRYPTSHDLEALLASRIECKPGSVLVTAGADEGLERAIRAVCAPGSRALLTTPSFEMIRRYLRLAGAEVVETPWWSGDYPVEQVVGIADQRTTLVTVVSPNNPTGATISASALVTLARSLSGCLILLDHAYVEMADEDLTGLALRLPNVLVLRTFSKAWGLAGLRVGWVAGDPTVLGWLRTVGQPYPVSAVSLLVAEQLLRAQAGPCQDYLATVRQQRKQLTALLVRLGAEPLPSAANFVLARYRDAAGVRQALAERGIAVRGFAGRSQLSRYLRITLPGEPVAYQRLTEALTAVLGQQQEPVEVTS